MFKNAAGLPRTQPQIRTSELDRGEMDLFGNITRSHVIIPFWLLNCKNTASYVTNHQNIVKSRGKNVKTLKPKLNTVGCCVLGLHNSQGRRQIRNYSRAPN